MFKQSLLVNGKFKSQVGKCERFAYKNQRVKVYRNLNKPDYFSMQACDGADKGKVIGYAKCVKLSNVTFKVSAAGQQRVLCENRKNVHSFVIGILEDASEEVLPSPHGLEATYNPYLYNYFFDRKTGIQVEPHYPSCVVQGASVFLS